MKRRSFLTGVGLGAAALSFSRDALTTEVRENRQEKMPNILFYVVDDMGMNDAGCFGHPSMKTPGLDRLAAEGIRFTQAYCTTASCSPSRSVLLTGMHNHATGQYGLAHGYHHFISLPKVRSLPVLLAEAGYRTVCAGKYHVEPEPLYHFQQYLKVDSPVRMADACRPVLETNDGSPFFLHFATVEPHRPFHREGFQPPDPNDVLVPPYLPDTQECREELAAYYASVERADSGLLRLIELLHETGHWEDTVIVFLSDNGIAFPGAKTTVYDPGIHLPCVVRDPSRAKQGTTCEAMIGYADIAPTLLDFAGVNPENISFHGRSFRGILGEIAPPGWDEVYASHTFHEVTMYYPMRAVRTRRHKLIWNIAHGLEYPFASDLWESRTWQGVLARGDEFYGRRRVADYLHRPRFELYDLEQDPDEVHNLAEDPGHATLLEEMKAKLRAFQKRTKDPWILKWERE